MRVGVLVLVLVLVVGEASLGSLECCCLMSWEPKTLTRYRSQ